MTVLSAKLTIYIPHSFSLKDKRKVSKSIIQKSRNKFNLSISEVDTQEIYQTLTLGIAVVSSSYTHCQNMVEEIIRFIETNVEGELLSIERE